MKINNIVPTYFTSIFIYLHRESGTQLLFVIIVMRYVIASFLSSVWIRVTIKRFAFCF